jgi:Tol biopolymer transport system component/DNA-binding winged helix-turn-helix (wHTH) protein
MTAETGRSDGPIDLADEADFQLGALLVSPSTREVGRGELRELLEPRVMQVLVALFRADGRVVSRDELIARCWEGRIVGEDAINRAIGRLRRLSEADGEASFGIETIPRVGYRLVPAVTARRPAPLPAEMDSLPVLTAPVQAQPPPGPQSPWLRHRMAFAGAIALAAIATAAWLFWPEAKWTVESSRPFISSLALEDYPAFSPDGATLAYSAETEGGMRKIYVRSLTAGDGIKVTSDNFDDTAPSWSSDGGHIAYVGSKPGEPCHLMVATVPAGAVREAGRCGRGATSTIAWQPGTNFLYFLEHGGLTGDTIFRLDLDSGAQIPIVHMPRMNQLISSLQCSPNGKFLAYILVTDVVIRDLASGQEKTLAVLKSRVDQHNQLAWTPDSRTVLASTYGGSGSEINAFPFDGRPSYRVYATALRAGRLAAGARVLAMVTDISRINFARPVSAATDEAAVVDPASGYSWSPSFAPDGTLAFLSNRSGTNAVWIQKPGTAAAQLFDGGFAALHRVQFSPDGSRLAVVTEALHKSEIKVMTLDGATLQTFVMPASGLGLPTWTQDGKALLVFDSRDKRTWRVAAGEPAKRSPFTPPHWVGVADRPQGRFAIRADKPGIWRIDGAPTLVTDKYPAYYDPPLAFHGADVLVPEYSGATPRLLAQPLSGGADRLLGYMPGAANETAFLQSAIAVNPKTGDIFYTATVGRDTNIDLLSLAKR